MDASFKAPSRARRLLAAGATGLFLLGGGLVFPGSAALAQSGQAADLRLMISTKADRSGAVPLTTNYPVSGKVAVFLQADTPVTSVQFYLDDQHRTKTPMRTDKAAPFDFWGGTDDGRAVLLDAATLKSGRHVFSAYVVRASGTKKLVNATVKVVGGTASPAPTTTPEPTPSTTPTSSPAPVTGFPSEKNTGVPDGVTLTPSGGLTITTPGTVIDAKDISGGVTIKAANVTIKRSRITGGNALYPVRVTSGSVVIEDSEITGGKGVAVCCANYTLRRVDIHDVFEGPRLGDNTTVEKSYIHHLLRCAGCHIDALQSTGGKNIKILGNNIQAYNPRTKDPMNAAFQFGEESAPLRDCLVDGNLMNGGNYTVNGGGGKTTGAQCTFSDNQFQRDFRYGAMGNIHSGVIWRPTNVWFDSKAQVKP